MVFSTDSDLSYVYLQYKSEKVHGLFGLGWKNQEHTVIGNRDIEPGFLCMGLMWAFMCLEVGIFTCL